MIKGCQRKMIMVKGEEDSPFEMAYFVLKSDPRVCDIGESDILAEANRIVEAKTLSHDGVKVRKNKKDTSEKNKKVMIPFAAGAAVGSAVGLLWLFI